MSVVLPDVVALSLLLTVEIDSGACSAGSSTSASIISGKLESRAEPRPSAPDSIVVVGRSVEDTCRGSFAVEPLVFGFLKFLKVARASGRIVMSDSSSNESSPTTESGVAGRVVHFPALLA